MEAQEYLAGLGTYHIGYGLTMAILGLSLLLLQVWVLVIVSPLILNRCTRSSWGIWSRTLRTQDLAYHNSVGRLLFVLILAK